MMSVLGSMKKFNFQMDRDGPAGTAGAAGGQPGEKILSDAGGVRDV